MSGPLPTPITVTPAQEAVLTKLRRQASCPQALALRMHIVLGAAAGQRKAPLARQLGCWPRTVRKWRGRWGAGVERLAAGDADPHALEQAIATTLAEAPRPGAPATCTAERISQIINRACRPPEQRDRPLTAWTPPELAAAAVKHGIVPLLSPRSGERFLKGRRLTAASSPRLAQRQNQGRGPRGLCRASGTALDRLRLCPEVGRPGLSCHQHRRDARHPGPRTRGPPQPAPARQSRTR